MRAKKHKHKKRFKIMGSLASIGLVAILAMVGLAGSSNTWFNTISSGGPTISSGSSSVIVGNYMYVLHGSGTSFSKYTLATHNWTSLTAFSGGTIGDGSSLVYPGSGDYIYATRGNTTTDFWRYSIFNNSWSQMTSTPATISSGSSMAYSSDTTYDTQGNIYLTRGGSTNTFYRYCLSSSGSCTANTWQTSPATVPFTIGGGGSLTKVGTQIYALGGNTTGNFAKYNPVSNTWSTLTSYGANITAGGSLSYPGTGNYLYALRGGSTTDFKRYDTVGDSWTSLTSAPSSVGTGASLSYTSNTTYDTSGNFYAMRGSSTSDQWRYCISTSSSCTANTWEIISPTVCPTQSDVSTMSNTVNGYSYIATSSGSFYKYNITTGICTTLTSFGLSSSYNISLEPLNSDTILLYGNNSTIGQYIISQNAWVGKSNLGKSKATGETPISQSGTSHSTGANLVAKPTTNELFIFPGNSTTAQKFDVVLNTWTNLGAIPGSISSGSASAISGNIVYLLRGGATTNLYSYDTTQTAPGSWSSLNAIPTAVNAGGALTVSDGQLYAFIGGSRKEFYRYCITGTSPCVSAGAWQTLTSAPDFVQGGGALTSIGTTIYATQGNFTRSFWKYDVSSDTWNSGGIPAQLPRKVGSGASLTNDGTYIYATEGLNSKSFWRYCPLTSGTCANGQAANTWAEIAQSPALGVGSSGTVNSARGGMSFSQNLNAIFLMSGNGVSGLNTTAGSGLIYRYDTASGTYPNTWVYFNGIPDNPMTASSSAGSELVRMGTSAYDSLGEYIYQIRGGATQDIIKYAYSKIGYVPWSKPLIDSTSFISNDLSAISSAFTDNSGANIVENQGLFYIVGSSNYFYAFNPSTNNWNRLADLPAATSSYGNGLLKIDTNTIGYQTTTGFYKYNITKNIWLTTTQGATDSGDNYDNETFSTAGQSSGYWAVDVQGKIFLIGGSNIHSFDPTANTWTTLATVPASYSSGGSATVVGTTIYTLFGNNTRTFYKYDTLTNTWTSLANYGSVSTDTVGAGGALAYYPGGGGDYIYGLRGGLTNGFWRYSISGNSWTQMTSTPGLVQGGGALTYTSDTTFDSAGNIYATSGNSTSNFWRYCISTSVTCTANTWQSGGQSPQITSTDSTATVRAGAYIYTLAGGSTRYFYRYDTANQIWSVMADFGNASSTVSTGASLVYPGSGDYIYGFRGNNTTEFWRYSISGNSWAQMGNTPSAVSSGAALAYTPDTTYDSAGNIYAFRGNGTTDFWRYCTATAGTCTAGQTANTWVSAAVYGGGTVGGGASLTTVGNNIYGTRGNSTRTFYQYTPSTNTWTSKANVGTTSSHTISNGSGMASDGSTYIYTILGGSTVGYFRYNVAGDSWSQLRNLPNLSSTGTNITYDSSTTYDSSGNVYIMGGNNTQYFWRYCISTSVSCTADTFQTPTNSSAPTQSPSVLRAGGGLAADGSGNIYLVTGNSNQKFYKYIPSSNSWTRLQKAPVAVGQASDTIAYQTLLYSSTTGDIFMIPGTGTSGNATPTTALIYRYKLSSGSGQNTWVNAAKPGGSSLPDGSGYGLTASYDSSSSKSYIFPGAASAIIISRMWILNGLTNEYDIFKKGTTTSGLPFSQLGVSQSVPTGVNIGTKLYVVSNSTITSYDLSTNTWDTTLQTLPTTNSSVTKYDNNTLYISNLNSGLITIYKYDVPSDTLTRLTSYEGSPTNRGSLSYPGSGNYLYYFLNAATSKFVRYNITTDTWDDAAVADQTDANTGAGNETVSLNGYIYATIGLNSGTSGSLKFYRYDIGGNSWSAMADLPSTNTSNAEGIGPSGALGTDGTYVYAMKGMGTRYFWRYCPGPSACGEQSANTWTEMTSPPITVGTRTTGSANSALIYYPSDNDFYFVVQGTTSGNSSSSSSSPIMWRYDIDTNTWPTSSLNSIPTARTSSNTAVSQEGFPTNENGTNITSIGTKIYVATGGMQKFSYYDTSTNTWTKNLAVLPHNEGNLIAKGESDTIIYVLSKTGDFKRYNVGSDTYTDLVDPFSYAGSSILEGWSMIYPGAGDYMYLARGGNTTTFYRYSITGNSWGTMATTPAAIYTGGRLAVTSNTDFIYASAGSINPRKLYRYTISSNTWTTLTDAPADVGAGGGIISDGNDIFLVNGGNNSAFRKYCVSGSGCTAGAWSSMSSFPANVGTLNSASLAYISSTNDIYYLNNTANAGDGNITTTPLFWRYRVANNDWPTHGSSLYINGVVYSQENCTNTVKTPAGGYIYAIVTLSTDLNCRRSTYLAKYDVANNYWVSATALPTITNDGVAMAYDGSTYLYLTHGDHTTDFWRYNTTNDTFEVLANTPVKVGATISSQNSSREANMIYYNGYIWLIPGGGCSTTISLTSCNLLYRYDPATDTWPTVEPAVKPIDVTNGFAAGTDSAVTSGTNFYLSQGGNSASNPNFWKFDLSKEAGEAISTGGLSQGSNTSATMVGNKIYIAPNTGTSFEYYDIAKNTWTTNLTALPSSTNLIAKGENTDTIYVLTTSGAFSKYTISTNSYSSLASAPASPSSTGWAMVYPGSGNYMYVFQGGNGVFWRYNVSTNTWDDAGAADIAGVTTGAGASIAAYSTNLLYATLGTSHPSTIYQYNIGTNTWASSGTYSTPRITIGTGAAIASDGVAIYVAHGGSRKNLSKLCIGISSSCQQTTDWSQASLIPEAVGTGGSGNLLYNSTLDELYYVKNSANNGTIQLWRYRVANADWPKTSSSSPKTSYGAWQQMTAMPTIPSSGNNAVFGSGGSLAYDGNDSIYAFKGNNSTDFQKYSITGNSWSNVTAQQFATAVGAAVTTPNRGKLILDQTTQTLFGAPGGSTAIYKFDNNLKLDVVVGSPTYTNTAFTVTVYLNDASGTVTTLPGTSPASDRTITLSLNTGTGALGGTLTGTLVAGTNSVVFNDITYNTTENGVSINASASNGSTNINSGTSNTFNSTVSPPINVNISPSSGPTSGFTSIAVSGENFVSGAVVKINGKKSLNTVFNSSTSITANTPPSASTGSYSVTVTNPDGQIGTSSTNFTYANPTVTLVTPDSGDYAGGTDVTITGTNFGVSRYMKPIAISNTTGGTLTDFQVKIGPFNTQTIVQAGHLNTDCSDLRVFDSDKATSLDYWVEPDTSNNQCNKTDTVIWVKIPSLPNGGKTIYLNYGNPTYTSTASGSDVFLFFDDFSGSSYSTTNWKTTTGSPTVSGGYLTLDGTEGLTAYHSSSPGYALPHSTIIETSANKQSAGLIGAAVRAATTDVTGFVHDGGANILDILWWAGDSLYGETNSGETVFPGGFTNARNFNRYQIVYRPGDADTSTFTYIGSNGTSNVTRSGNNSSGTLYPVMYCSNCTNSANSAVQYDWILVRKYASTEPVADTSAAEVLETVSANFDAAGATNEAQTNSTTMTATTPAHSAGLVNVTVFNPDNSSGTGTDLYTYIAPDVPDAPTLDTAAPNNAAADLSWTAPGYNGGSAITNYDIQYGNATTCDDTEIQTWNHADCSHISVANITSTTVSSLTNGSNYRFAIFARNTVGRSTASNRLTAIPDNYLNTIQIHVGNNTEYTYPGGTTQAAGIASNTGTDIDFTGTPTTNNYYGAEEYGFSLNDNQTSNQITLDLETLTGTTKAKTDLNEEIEGTNNSLSKIIRLPFPVYAYGRANNVIKIATNGFIYMNREGSLSSTSNGATDVFGMGGQILTTGNDILVAARHTYLDVDPTSIIDYKVTGTAPNRVFIINFQNLSYGSSTDAGNNFQIKLKEQTSPQTASSGNSTVTASKATAQTSDGSNLSDIFTSIITVTLKDASNDPIFTHEISLSPDNGTTPATPVDCTTLETLSVSYTDQNGQACFRVTSSVDGLQTFTATDETNSVAITDTADVTFSDTINYLTQSNYIFRNDDGTEITATAAAPQNTALNTLNKNTDATRLRFVLDNNTTEAKTILEKTLNLSGANHKVFKVMLNSTDGYAYYVTQNLAGTASKLYKVQLSDLGLETSVDLPNYVDTAEIDIANNIAYFGYNPGSSPTLLKYNLTSMTSSGTLALTGNSTSNVESISIDSDTGFLYAGIYTPADGTFVSKVKISDYSEVGQTQLSTAAAFSIARAEIDITNHYLYLVMEDPSSTTKVVKLDLNTDLLLPPNEVAILNLNLANNKEITASAYDTTNNILYLASNESNSRIFKVDTRPQYNFTTLSTLTLTGQTDVYGDGVIDETNQRAFFTVISPNPKIIKLNLATFAHNTSTQQLTFDYYDFTSAQSLAIDANKGYLYTSGYSDSTTEPKAYKVSTAPHATLKLNYGLKTSSCSANDITWNDLGASEDWDFALSGNITDQAATTNVASLMTDSNEEFKAGEIRESDSVTNEISLGEKQFTELEYSIEPTSNATYDDYCFKLVNNRSTSPANPEDSVGIDVTNAAEVNLQKVIIKNDPLTVLEGGAAQDYTVELAEAPSSDVTIDLTTTEGLLTIEPEQLVFTNADYGPQTVSVSATNNSTTEGERARYVTASAVSADSAFNGISIRNATILLTDTTSSTSNVSVTVTGSLSMTTPADSGFPAHETGSQSPNFFRTQQSGEGNGSSTFKLTVEDNRGFGTDFRVQVQASTDFTKGTAPCIPLNNVYTAPSNFSNSNSFADTSISPVYTEDPNSIGSYTTSNRRLATTTDSNGCNATSQAITLLDTTLTSSEVKGTTSVDTNYAIDYGNISLLVDAGNYATTLTFTLIDNP